MTDTEKNINLYTALVAEHGLSHRSLNWGSKESQQKRFAILSDIGDLSSKNVLDVGCGLGDYCEWLKKQFGNVTYHGIDITEAMINEAQRRFPEVEFLIASVDKLPDVSFDYVFASGIFTYLGVNPYEQMFFTIKEMFSRASIGVGFNSLCSWVKTKEKHEFYSDPVKVIKYCSSLTTKLVLRSDYHMGDYTIYLYK